jgi:hypothetical protein
MKRCASFEKANSLGPVRKVEDCVQRRACCGKLLKRSPGPRIIAAAPLFMNKGFADRSARIVQAAIAIAAWSSTHESAFRSDWIRSALSLSVLTRIFVRKPFHTFRDAL